MLILSVLLNTKNRANWRMTIPIGCPAGNVLPILNKFRSEKMEKGLRMSKMASDGRTNAQPVVNHSFV